jgi:hypothetical protein
VATLGAFFDANVLYPSGLRNFLMHLALTGIFRAHWSAEVRVLSAGVRRSEGVSLRNPVMPVFDSLPR